MGVQCCVQVCSGGMTLALQQWHCLMTVLFVDHDGTPTEELYSNLIVNHWNRVCEGDFSAHFYVLLL